MFSKSVIEQSRKHTILIVILIWVLVFMLGWFTVVVSLADAHETEEFKHGPCPQCNGWQALSGNMRLCFLDNEQDKCVIMIHSHGMWHVTEPMDCEEHVFTAPDDNLS